jgi:CRP-like cAMP-binding protein
LCPGGRHGKILFKEFVNAARRTEGGEMIGVERLRNVDIFEGLNDEELKTAAHFCQEESVGGGVTLCEEGARADKLFILEEGSVSMRLTSGSHYGIRTPGKILGWSFLVPPNRYTATAVTDGPCKLLVIKSPDFYDLIHKEAKLGLTIMDNLSKIVASRLKAIVEYH